jgi:hypothetical protein
MRTLLRSILSIVAVTSVLSAQQPTLRDTLLDRMTGHWMLSGTIAGKATVHDIDAEWVLGHQYVRIHEASREKNNEGGSQYEADVYVGWDQALSEYVCIWLDVWGGVTPQSIGRAKPNGDTIAFLFKDKDGAATFHTTFLYCKDADTWQWLMDNDDKGTLQPFARVNLTKK